MDYSGPVTIDEIEKDLEFSDDDDAPSMKH